MLGIAGALTGYLETPTVIEVACTADLGQIRGLSEIIVLHEILARARTDPNQEVPHPYEYFNMICGTSTGGYASNPSRTTTPDTKHQQSYLYHAWPPPDVH